MAVSFSASGPHQLARFREVIGEYPGIWNSLDIRYSAIKAYDLWWNVATEIRLHYSDPGPPESESLVRLEDFVAGRLSLPFSELGPILDQVDRQELRLGDHEFKLAYPTRGANGSMTAYPLHLFFSVAQVGDSWRSFWQPEPDCVTFQAGAPGGSFQELLDQHRWSDIERRLLLHEPPYFGMEDLMLYFLRANQPLNLGGGSKFWLSAPLYTRIEGQELTKDRTLALRVRAPPGARCCNLRIVGRKVKGSAIERVVIRATEDESILAGSEPVTFTVPLEACDWVDGALIFGKERVDRFQLALPSGDSANPRLAALAITDLGNRRLEEFIAGDEGSLRLENAQEVGLSWIFALCGFQVLSTGLRGFNMGSAPDLVAFVPYSNSVIVLEATLRDLMAEDKLVRLRDRAERLSRQLPNFEVVAVAATAKSNLTAPEISLTDSLGVRVLLQADVARLREFAMRNDSPRSAFDFIKAKRNVAT